MDKIRNWSRGGKRVPAAVHCKQQLPSDPFSNTCYLGRRGALQQRNTLFHQRWSHQTAFRLIVGSIPWCSEFPTCYFYVSVGSLLALWPSTPPKTAKKEISCGANKVFSTGFIYNIFPLCFIIGGGTTGDFTKRRYRNIELAPRC